jgi:TonB family protein
MDFFDRHKALIITLLIFGILILGLYNFNLSNSNQKAREFLVDLDNYRLEEQAEPEPEPEEAEQQPQTRPSMQTHRAFNEEQEARNENFDQQLNEILDRNSANREESSENEAESSSGDYNIANTPRKKPQQRSDGNNTSNETSTQSGGIDNSSITFSLVGRSAVHIPNPIYTCDRAGKVVVNITVDAQGRVTSTSLNKGSSTSSNQCLTENALQYAAGAIFSQLQGRNSQPGTITYYFQP